MQLTDADSPPLRDQSTLASNPTITATQNDVDDNAAVSSQSDESSAAIALFDFEFCLDDSALPPPCLPPPAQTALPIARPDLPRQRSRQAQTQPQKQAQKQQSPPRHKECSSGLLRMQSTSTPLHSESLMRRRGASLPPLRL